MFFFTKMSVTFKQFLRYCVVGGFVTFVDLSVLYLLVEYQQFPVIPGTILSFFVALITSYLLNKSWTFKNRSKNHRKQFIKFAIVSGVGLGLTVSFMYLFFHIFSIWYMLAKAMTSLIVLFWNFLGNKFWTFTLKRLEVLIPDKFGYDFSIVIPAYNEENRIKGTLLAIEDFIRKNLTYSYEVIVVDDGSSDKTSEIASQYKDLFYRTNNDVSKVVLNVVRYEKNRGKGFAVKTGVENAHGKYILFTDADNSTPIEELFKLYEYIKQGDDVVIGSRYLKDSNVKIKQSRYRIFMGRFGNLLIKITLINGIKDTQCGFKLFTHQAAKEIFVKQKVTRFGFDMEALVIAKNLGLKIKEVPVSWFNSVESRVRPVRDGFKTLKELIYIKLNLWGGRYSDDS